MSEDYTIDAKQYAGRKIVIEIPPQPKRSYIACNKKNWEVCLSNASKTTEGDFLWNFEQGHKVIYSSNITRITQDSPLDMTFSIPLWSLTPGTIYFNDKPYMDPPECTHDYSSDSEFIGIDRLSVEGSFECPATVFSSKVDNGYGVYMEIYLETGSKTFTIWDYTFNLKNPNEYKRAKFKGKEYYVWDSSVKDKFSIDSGFTTEALVKDGINLGITIKFICSSEVYLGKKEDLESFFFKLTNFNYVLQLSDL